MADKKTKKEIIKKALHLIDNWFDFQTYIKELPSVAVGIFVEDEIIFKKEYGYADLENKSKLTDQHLFRIASHSKLFTATAIMKLYHEEKLSIDEFLQQGEDKGIWNENFKLITKKNSLYGTGKSLLASLSIALKGYCINSQIDYKVIGENLCKVFSIEIKESTKEPYKSFQSGNSNHIRELKRTFRVNKNS